MESRISKRYLQTYVPNATIHNNQEAEATHVSIDGWMDEPNGVDTDTGISVSLKKERNTDTCYDMDEPSGHYAKDIVTARQILSDSALGGGIQGVQVTQWESRMGWASDIGTQGIIQQIQFCKLTSFGDGSHNHVNILHTAELHT